MRSLPLISGAIAFCAAVIIGAQTGSAPAPKYGVMNLETRIGSFVIIGTERLAEGRVEISFTGTLLVSQLEGKAGVTGKVRQEFDGMGRRVWFGTGKAVIEGKWRKLQWFGKDMKAQWRGRGTALLYGEYDAKTDSSGTVQVDDLYPEKWRTTGHQVYVPKELDPAWEVIKDKVKRLPGKGR